MVPSKKNYNVTESVCVSGYTFENICFYISIRVEDTHIHFNAKTQPVIYSTNKCVCSWTRGRIWHSISKKE